MILWISLLMNKKQNDQNDHGLSTRRATDLIDIGVDGELKSFDKVNN